MVDAIYTENGRRYSTVNVIHPADCTHEMLLGSELKAWIRVLVSMASRDAYGFVYTRVADVLGSTETNVQDHHTGKLSDSEFSDEALKRASAGLCTFNGGPPTTFYRRKTGSLDTYAFDVVRDLSLAVGHLVKDESPELEVIEPLASAPQRPSWDTRLLRLARWWGQWGTCTKLHTGAVVVDADHQVLVSGYNGAPRGFPHCDGQLSDERHCLACIHAEANCLLQASRLGVALKGATMYATHRPCIRCSRMLAQVGLERLVYLHDYDSDENAEAALQTLERAGTVVDRWTTIDAQ